MKAVFFSSWGRSERGRKRFQIPGLKFVLRLLDLFFGTYSWQFTDPGKSEQEAVNREQFTAPSVPKLVQSSRKKTGPVTVLSRRKASQTWCSQRNGGIKIAANISAIDIRSGISPWREDAGLRGPPWALISALYTVRLQE